MSPGARLRLMDAWDRYWFGEVAAIRPYLLVKAVLCMVAFDAWLLMVPLGGRYGAGGFDVAHFQWLDDVQPLPNPRLYVFLMLSVGMLALVCAFADAGRWARALLALTFTYGWAMSFHDSFQHHYFLSLVLTLFVFFPRLRSRDLYPTAVPSSSRKKAKPGPSDLGKRAVSSWTYALLGVNVGIVYAFTALTKLDPEWRTGEVLWRFAGPRLGSWMGGFASSRGVWGALALGVFTTECLIALGYFLVVRLDEHRSQLLQVVARLTLIVAVGFHLGIELFVEGIGWFSYYMIVLACVYFLPTSLLWTVGGSLARPALRLAGRWSMTPLTPTAATSVGTIALTLAVATAVAVGGGAIGFSLDLPGAEALGLVVASVVAGATLLAVVLGLQHRAMHFLLATGVAAVMMWATIALSTVRFYYYGHVGMDMWRRGDPAAVEAFDRANRYAPEAQRLERFLENR